MDYRHVGYFLAVCVVVFGAISGWLIRMFVVEGKTVKRLSSVVNKSKERTSNHG